MTLLLVGFGRTSTPRWTCSSCRKLSKLAAVATTRAQYKLPDSPARTRFAPSPTGYLHLGSLRTALFSYLLAKSTNGQFLLRIEDTDQARTIPDAEARIKEDLKWAGLQWDEGPDVGGSCGPYKQSERLDIYREYAAKLLDTGKAYRCFCPREKLDLTEDLHFSGGLRPHDCNRVSKATSDDRAAQGKPFVVRLKLPEYTKPYRDLVFGKVKGSKMAPTAVEPVLMKSDNWPTYHLACVVDDHLMKITHVIRGSEWIPSVPTHLHIYEAFGWQPPVFGHVGLLTDLNGQKLSKRNFDLDISAYKDMGVLPDALANFVALLGWSHTQTKDMMNLHELVQNFSTKFTKGDTKVSFDKLWFLQKQHGQRAISSAKTPEDLLSAMIQPIVEILKDKGSSWVGAGGIKPAEQPLRLLQILKADALSYKNARDFVERHQYTFDPPSAEDLRSANSSIVTLGHLNHLSSLPTRIEIEIPNATIVETVNGFSAVLPQENSLLPTDEQGKRLRVDFLNIVEDRVRENLASINAMEDEELSAMLKKSWAAVLHKYLRWALVADSPGPDSINLMAALGRKDTLRRLDLAGKVAIAQAESGRTANEKK